MLSTFRQAVILNGKNIPGWRINRKIVVIECDDWGGIRMPSKKVYDELLRFGIPVNSNRFSKYDTLAGKEDLEQLFNILLQAKDSKGNPAVMTPVTNPANPDFEKIKASGYREYFYEPFTKTLENYQRHSDTLKWWKKGIEMGIFEPVSHGREHITVPLWLKKLQEGDKNLRYAFEHQYVSVDVKGIPEVAQQFRPEFFFTSTEDIDFLKHSIKDGVRLFNEIFGFIPKAFVPSNGIFHPLLEEALSETGVPFLYVSHRNPIYDVKGNVSYKWHRFGQKSPSGLTYYIRNCAFEPTDETYAGIGITLKQIEAAFRWHKPAIISTHRVNFVGGIDIKNREKGLTELKILLKTIVYKWPDVEFMSSRALFEIMQNNA